MIRDMSQERLAALMVNASPGYWASGIDSFNEKTERCEVWNKQKKRILKMISKAKFIWSAP